MMTKVGDGRVDCRQIGIIQLQGHHVEKGVQTGICPVYGEVSVTGKEGIVRGAITGNAFLWLLIFGRKELL